MPPADFGYIFVLILHAIGLSNGQSSPYSTLSERHSSVDGPSEREGRNLWNNDHHPPLPPRYVPKFSRFTPFQTVESLPGPQFGRPSLAPPPLYQGNFGGPPPFGRRHPFEGGQLPRGQSRLNSSQSNSRENIEENERNLNENGQRRGEGIKSGGGGKFGNNFGKETSGELPSTFPRPSHFEGQRSSAENMSSNISSNPTGSFAIDEAKNGQFLNATTPFSPPSLASAQPSASFPNKFVNSSMSSSLPSNNSSKIHSSQIPPSNQSTTFQNKYSPLQIRPNVPYGPELVARLANQNFWSPTATTTTTMRPNGKAEEEEKASENGGNRRISGENENDGQKWNGPSKVFFTPPSNNGGRFGPEEREKNSRDGGENNGRNSRENEPKERREQFGGESSVEQQRGLNGKRRPGRFSRESEEKPAIGQFQRRGHSRIGSGENERRQNWAENSREFGHPPKARPPPPRRWGSEEESGNNRRGNDRPNSREYGHNSGEKEQSHSSERSSFVGSDGNRREDNNEGGGGKHHRPFVPPKSIPNPGEFLPEHIRNAFPPFPEPFERERNRPSRGGHQRERKRRAGEVHMHKWN